MGLGKTVQTIALLLVANPAPSFRSRAKDARDIPRCTLIGMCIVKSIVHKLNRMSCFRQTTHMRTLFPFLVSGDNSSFSLSGQRHGQLDDTNQKVCQ
jgi:hypothetical protein